MSIKTIQSPHHMQCTRNLHVQHTEHTQHVWGTIYSSQTEELHFKLIKLFMTKPEKIILFLLNTLENRKLEEKLGQCVSNVSTMPKTLI